MAREAWHAEGRIRGSTSDDGLDRPVEPWPHDTLAAKGELQLALAQSQLGVGAEVDVDVCRVREVAERQPLARHRPR